MKLRGLAAGAFALVILAVQLGAPIAQMGPGRNPPVPITGASTVYTSSQVGQIIARSNSGAAMIDQLPGGTVPQEGWSVTVKNDDATALGSIGVANGIVTGSISGTTLTAASGLTGTLKAGQYLGAANGSITAGTKIIQQLSGTPGGAGGATYQIFPGQTVSSTAITFGATLDGSVLAYVPLGPTQSATFISDGVMSYRSVGAPIRAKVPAGSSANFFITTSSGAATGPCLTQATACVPQVAIDTVNQRFDVGASQVIYQAYAASLPANIPGFLMRGKPPGLGNSSSSNPFYHSVMVLGDAATPSNYVLTNPSGNCAQAIQSSFHIKGFTVSGCLGDGINASSQSTVGLEAIAFVALSGADIVADDSSIHWDSNLTKTGAADCHMLSRNGGYIRANSGGLVDAITAGVWGTGNYCVQSGGNIANLGTTQTGTATGPKFAAGPFGGAFAIGTLGTDPNTLLKGSTNGVYDLTGPANDVAAPGNFSTVNITGGTINSDIAMDSGHNLTSVTSAAAAAANTDTFSVNQGAGMLKQSFTAVQTWIRGWITKTDVGLGNVANVDTTNAANISSGTLPVARLSLSEITASLGADVALNNTANYFDGPFVAQGSTGTWSASGTVTVLDTTGAARIDCKLWDGTSVIASTESATQGSAAGVSISLSGKIATPAGNIRISCKDLANTTGAIKFNMTGNSKDSTITAYRLN